MLPFLVAAMAFLGALTLAGAVGVGAVARHWRAGAGAALTVQVPEPANPAASGRSGTRVAAVVAALRDSPGIAAARALTDAELAALLRPWLGSGTDRLALPLPAVIEVRLAAGGADLTALTPRLQAVAPGTVVESHGVWIGRLTALARSLEACAAVALLVVAAVAAVVIAVATRGGLAARREVDRDRAWSRRDRRLHRGPVCVPRYKARGLRRPAWRPGGDAGAAGSRRSRGAVRRRRC